ncbi:MAG: MBL fold metallo-hydrolase [Phycisphaerales bacterium]
MTADPAMTIRPIIEPFPLGPYATNCYLVYPSARLPPAPGTPCWIVDASFDPEPIIQRIGELGLRPELIYLTHAHVDHIAGLRRLREAFPGVPVALHEAERRWLGDPMLNLSEGFGQPMTFAEPEQSPAHEDRLTLGGLGFTVLHVPGHSPGSTALVWLAEGGHEGEALVGDALFAGSIGRTDFPTSDHDALLRSIEAHLYALPDPVRVWPGHGPMTTIGREAATNPFVRRRK